MSKARVYKRIIPKISTQAGQLKSVLGNVIQKRVPLTARKYPPGYQQDTIKRIEQQAAKSRKAVITRRRLILENILVILHFNKHLLVRKSSSQFKRKQYQMSRKRRFI